MGPQKNCIDIITELGGIKDLKAAQQVFKVKLDAAEPGQTQPHSECGCAQKNRQCDCALSNLTLFLSIRDPRKTGNLSESFL